jgi:hypothetical protein
MKMSDQKETRIIYLGQCIYFDKKIESESKIAEKEHQKTAFKPN